MHSKDCDYSNEKNEPTTECPIDGDCENDKTRRLACKGLLFRAVINHFPHITDKYKYFESSTRMRFLKRKSCPGCEYCDWMWEYMKEQVDYTDGLNTDHYNDMWIYKLLPHGQADDCILEFEAVENNGGRPVVNNKVVHNG